MQGQGGKALEEGRASTAGSFANISMNGSEVFKFAVRAVPTVVQQALDSAGLVKADIDWLLLHQANQRILDSAAQRLGVPPVSAAHPKPSGPQLPGTGHPWIKV